MSMPSLRERIRDTVSGAILDAAEAIAAEVGPSATRMQAVAERAQVAVGTIYNHFADRNELFDEVFARRRAELLSTLDAATKRSTGERFQAQLEAFVRTVLSFFDARRTFLRFALDGNGGTPRAKRGGTPTSLEQLSARAERIIRVGIKEGRIRTDAVELLGIFLVTAMRAVLVARVTSPNPLADETENIVTLFLNGAAR